MQASRAWRNSKQALRNNNTSEQFAFTYSLRADIVASGNGMNPPPETPEVTCTALGTRIYLSWKPSERASDYVIYRYDPDRESVAKMDVTQSTEYLLTGLARNTPYNYLVVSRDEVGVPGFYTYATNVVSAVTGYYEGAPVIFSQPESVWTQADNAISDMGQDAGALCRFRCGREHGIFRSG